ncbi:hypothetical protein L0337_25370 [candidate division KSB1 bacterium]|nr:hypothetical protein [candidate division KSB1 bacterium]
MTLNDRLDYFGSTINVAARLEGQSSGSDVIISAPVRNDPEVITWLEHQAESIRLESLETQLKGFDEQRFELWRVARCGEWINPALSPQFSNQPTVAPPASAF